jgi:hypothetical protein
MKCGRFPPLLSVSVTFLLVVCECVGESMRYHEFGGTLVVESVLTGLCWLGYSYNIETPRCSRFHDSGWQFPERQNQG